MQLSGNCTQTASWKQTDVQNYIQFNKDNCLFPDGEIPTELEEMYNAVDEFRSTVEALQIDTEAEESVIISILQPYLDILWKKLKAIEVRILGQEQ